MKFSVLMSVYIKENPIFFKKSLESILVNQSLLPNEVVIVKDGPLTEELDSVIIEFKNKFKSIIKVVKLEENKGLGIALNEGIKNCSNEIIARMDTDDISDPFRFEKQIKIFKSKKVDLVGSNIGEFFSDENKIEFIKKVPENMDSILKMMRFRNPINHMTVMFKKSSVIDSGGYIHMLYLEDYYLWVRMVENNCVFYNIQEELVKVRTGKEMFKRRSNKAYISSWNQLQKKMYDMGIIKRYNVIKNMISIIVFIYIPPIIKQYVYKYLLRR